MQLFISSWYNIIENKIIITDPRIVHQCFHVLRYTKDQLIQLQNNTIRYTLQIELINKKEIITSIHKEEKKEKKENILTTMIVALPNRRDKAELIVQKLTEIGIDNIVFRKAERSIIRQYPEKKHERLETISSEASEQSFRRETPLISYIDNIVGNPIIENWNLVLFQYGGNSASTISTSNNTIQAIIGPEWWFSNQELNYLKDFKNVQQISLGETILRMETASIIWGRLLKQI